MWHKSFIQTARTQAHPVCLHITRWVAKLSTDRFVDVSLQDVVTQLNCFIWRKGRGNPWQPECHQCMTISVREKTKNTTSNKIIKNFNLNQIWKIFSYIQQGFWNFLFLSTPERLIWHRSTIINTTVGAVFTCVVPSPEFKQSNQTFLFSSTTKKIYSRGLT